VVTMSQISFVPQAAKSVSQALMSDSFGIVGCTPDAGCPKHARSPQYPVDSPTLV
jgi:hypothetical protein